MDARSQARLRSVLPILIASPNPPDYGGQVHDADQEDAHITPQHPNAHGKQAQIKRADTKVDTRDVDRRRGSTAV